MNESLRFLLQHPYSVIFVTVLTEQAGLPVPAAPFLMGAGALAGLGHVSVSLVLALAVGASLLADLGWYEAGRRRGASILRLLCRISLEPDSCIRRTEDTFSRQGAKTLLVAKFVPGLSTVGPPLAGVFGMPLARFLFFDGAGALLWASGYVILGYVFRNQLERAAEHAANLGGGLLIVLGSAFALWMTFKYVQRRRFMRSLRVARITPEELKAKLDAGEKIVVVDLRHSIEVAAAPGRIPGALHFTTEDLDTRHGEIPRDQDVVLYCTCPNEATSARVALLLKRRGISRVRPLAGGLAAWQRLRFPVEGEPAAQ